MPKRKRKAGQELCSTAAQVQSTTHSPSSATSTCTSVSPPQLAAVASNIKLSRHGSQDDGTVLGLLESARSASSKTHGRDKVYEMCEICCATCLELAQQGHVLLCMPCCTDKAVCLSCMEQCLSRRVRDSCPTCQKPVTADVKAQMLARVSESRKAAKAKQEEALRALEGSQ